ncbi:MAG TPA: hypothetical protein VK720_04105 [Terracidiphilus sp.]|jgi:hypothetical protein|nr:hypothetical protein [Terracidiphilus sp.]
MAGDRDQALVLYTQEIRLLFYKFRLAYFNRLYYTAQLSRRKKVELLSRLFFTLSTATALIALSLIPCQLTAWRHKITDVASVVSGLSFVLSIALLIMGWAQSISDLTSRVYAWHRAERQVWAAIRLILYTAESKRDADLHVQFADSAFAAADDLPDSDKGNKRLERKIRAEVERVIPPDYVERVI